MSKFDIDKYLPTQEDIVNEDESPIETPVEKQTKEVKIAKLGSVSASEVIAKALIEALRKEDIELIQKPEESGNGIFDNVKIVSTEEINSNLKGVLGELNEDDIIVTDMFIPNTMEEEMFDATVSESNIKVYNNLDKAARALASISRKQTEEVVETEEPNVGVDFRDCFPGDKVELDGISYEVVFRDSYVILLREETQHPNRKEDYVLFDCPKGV